MHNIHSLFLVCLLLMPVSGSVFAEAGMFQFASGDVRLVNSAGVERAARKGEQLNEGDTILTGSNGSAQIKMADGGFISVRANTRMKVDSYTYTGKQDGSEKSFFSLMAGGFRALTGLIGKLNKDNYKITTPSATIGIRGTDHEPMVVLPGQKALGEPGTYDKVNSGASFIATAKGVINIAPNQAGFVPGANAAPVILSKLPAFYKESPPVPVEELQKLQKLQDVDSTKNGRDEDDRRKDDQRSAAGEKKRAAQPGVIRTLESENEDGGRKDDKKAAAGEKRRAVQTGVTQATGSENATGAKVPSATGLPVEGAAAVSPAVPALMDKSPLAPTALPGKTAVPAGDAPVAATPLLAPLPGLSTTIKLVPLGTTTTQPLAAPVTTATPKDALTAPDSAATTTTKTLDSSLSSTPTIQQAPTTKTLDPLLSPTPTPTPTPAIQQAPTTRIMDTSLSSTPTIQQAPTTKILDSTLSPTPIPTPTPTQQLLTAPLLLSPTPTTIKTLP